MRALPRRAFFPPNGSLTTIACSLSHDAILIDELHRNGSLGVGQGLFGGLQIGAWAAPVARVQRTLTRRRLTRTSPGCPPIYHFGSQELQDRVLPEILSGKKRVCLAITEVNAGSDVKNLSTEAKLSEDGKHFIVNGVSFATRSRVSTAVLTRSSTGHRTDQEVDHERRLLGLLYGRRAHLGQGRRDPRHLVPPHPQRRGRHASPHVHERPALRRNDLLDVRGASSESFRGWW